MSWEEADKKQVIHKTWVRLLQITFLFDLYSVVILDFRPKGNDLYVII